MHTSFCALTCALALMVGGCALNPAGKSILQGGDSITAPITNPVGLNESYEIEATYATALSLSRAYFRLRQCRKSETASFTNPCSRRAIKVEIQKADLRVRAVLVPFRKFVRENQTVSALSLIGPLRAAVSDFRKAIPDEGV